MNLEMGLFQKQTMSLVMTQELRQAISLLQLSTQELSDYISEQALENPLIETEEPVPEEKELPIYDSPVMWTDDYGDGYEAYEGRNESQLDRIQAYEEGLADHLYSQIRFLDTTDQYRELLLYLADNVDTNGYLEGSWEEAGRFYTITEDEYEQGVKMLQKLEPAGVGARNLQECLLLQLTRNYPSDLLVIEVVKHHLEDLAARRWKQIAKTLHISVEDVQAIYDTIQQLTPHPCACIGRSESAAITPDVYVEKKNGTFTVVLNNETLPKIRLNKQYRHLLESGEQGEAGEYARKKYKQLVWLLKSIDQRQTSLRKITEAILLFQEAFFENGPAGMKPLTLREIAEEAEVHESTVSRTTTNKYVQTPHGLFELKHFFSAGMNNAEGEQTSTNVIKEIMNKMVEAENKKRPLSDQKIAELIKEEHGIPISRRAIAKYRGELQIASSSKRKRYA